MRIALIIRSLRGGGAERVCALMANGLAGRGHDVTVVTLSSPSDDDYPLIPAVRRKDDPKSLEPRNGAFGGVVKNLAILRSIRRAVTDVRPDIVISFVHLINLRVILALTGLGTPIILTEHNDAKRSKLSWPWQRLRRLLYPRAARLVTVGQGVDEGFRWFPNDRRLVIYNPILRPADSILTADARLEPANAVIAMGRLAEQKGFDLLIQAFALTRANYPNWTLTILGRGDDEPLLQRQIFDNNLQDSVKLAGFVRDPVPFLLASDIYVMSSRWEGFPLALGEAMAIGLAPVSFDCESGPREYIEHGQNGLLVEPENVPALAAALERLMGDPNLRRQLGAAARHSIARFDIEPILDQWESVFIELRRPVAASVETAQ